MTSRVLCGLAAALLAASAAAQVHDPAAGLEWRPLEETRFVTWEAAASDGGWVLASAADVAGLFLRKGADGPDGAWRLLQEWGALACCHSGGESMFWTSDEPGAAGDLFSDGLSWLAEPSFWVAPEGYQSFGLGAAMHRPAAIAGAHGAAPVSPVPLPAGWLLMAAGLGAMGWRGAGLRRA